MTLNYRSTGIEGEGVGVIPPHQTSLDSLSLEGQLFLAQDPQYSALLSQVQSLTDSFIRSNPDMTGLLLDPNDNIVTEPCPDLVPSPMRKRAQEEPSSDAKKRIYWKPPPTHRHHHHPPTLRLLRIPYRSIPHLNRRMSPWRENSTPMLLYDPL